MIVQHASIGNRRETCHSLSRCAQRLEEGLKEDKAFYRSVGPTATPWRRRRGPALGRAAWWIWVNPPSPYLLVMAPDVRNPADV